MKSLGNFTALGDEIARAWEAANGTHAAFTEIATARLRASGVLESTSLRDITTWFMSSNEVPPQTLTDFGQPPVRVYQGRGFFIELLFWIDTPTAIHEHAFAGAFGVLRGSSFHAQYRFEPRRRIGEQLVTGSLTLSSAELLTRGDVRPIEPGNAFIHSLMHLEAPSISVVVRTNVYGSFAQQMTYYPPGLSIDPFYREQPLMTQLALLRTLLRSQREEFRELALQVVGERDLFTAYKVLELVSEITGESAVLNELLGVVARRNDDLAAAAEAALREERRQSSLRSNLNRVTKPEHRFFLALLTNAPDRATIDALVQARFPGENPTTKLEALVSDIANDTRVFNLDKVSLRLLQFALRGVTFDAVSAAFDARFGAGHAGTQALRDRWEQLHSEPVIAALFRRPALTASR